MENKYNKRLSVIIPGYNTPKAWWRRCVQSVLIACGPNDEVICVDDGSKNPLSDFWQDVCNGDGRARLLVLKENSGQATARNAALDMAKGEFVTFVDSDDVIMRESYERCLDVQCEYSCDITVYGMRVEWTHDRLYKEDVLPLMDLGVLDGEALGKLVRTRLFDYTCNKVYRRSFLDRNKIRFEPDANPGEDTVFNLKCVLSGATWATVGYIGYVYYRYDGSSLSRYAPDIRRSLEHRTEMWRRCKDKCSGAWGVLGAYGEIGDKSVKVMCWKNLWRRGSPVPFSERWRYLKANPDVTSYPLAVEFAWSGLYGFLRKHFYFSFIRRRHIKRLFPNCHEVEKGSSYVQ